MKFQHALIAAAALVLFCLDGNAQDTRRLVDLRGEWKFELGDSLRWRDADFDDSRWDDIKVPSTWEDQGYPGYDGYAWYRKHFTAPASIKGKYLYLKLGRIDDVDEMYINGRFIGFTGEFPPHYYSTYSTDRMYEVPDWCLNAGGDNVIAVRVYDSELGGGMVGGEIGLFEEINALYPELSLDGTWKFRIGDDLSWKEKEIDDATWEKVYVPAYWETQGHRGYDGYGWYRLHFKVPSRYVERSSILLLGKIDDIDQAFINGEPVGHTGNMEGKPKNLWNSSEYAQLRAYALRAGLLTTGDNVLAVRVCDWRLHGGIYRDPIGLISRTQYNAWRDKNENNHSGPWKWLDWFLK